ncbi:MAG: CpaE family protein [Dongiaceae bacterium]
MSFAMNLRRGTAVAAEPTLGASSVQADCVAFVADPETHGAVTQVCGLHFPGLQVHNGGTKEAVDYLAAGAPPRILIVDVSDSNKPLSAMLPIIAAFAEDTRVIAIGAVNDIELYREMIEAGISDYLVKPIGEKALTVALERAEQRKSAAAAAPEPAAQVVADPGKRSVVAVMGTRGGVGASTLAMNLAWLIANEHKRETMLVDLDLQGGTVALALDVEPSHGLREVLDNPNRIDSLFVTSVATKCGDRLHVLAAEEAVDDEVHYNTSAVSLLLDELKKNSASVIVDLPRNAPGARAVVLAAATEIVVVTDLTLAGLRDAIRLYTMVQQVAPSARVIFVANRDGGREGTVSKAEFEKALGKPIEFVLPEDAKANQAAANAGKPVVAAAPGSKVTTMLKTLAKRLTVADGDKKQKKSFWSLSRK